MIATVTDPNVEDLRYFACPSPQDMCGISGYSSNTFYLSDKPSSSSITLSNQSADNLLKDNMFCTFTAGFEESGTDQQGTGNSDQVSSMQSEGQLNLKITDLQNASI